MSCKVADLKMFVKKPPQAADQPISENRSGKSNEQQDKTKIDAGFCCSGVVHMGIKPSESMLCLDEFARPAKSTVGATVARTLGSHAVAHYWSHARTWASSYRWVRTEHADPGTKFGSSERHHVLANVSGDDLTVLRIGMCEDVLDKVVAVLITRDVDEGNTGSVHTSLTDPIQVTA